MEHLEPVEAPESEVADALRAIFGDIFKDGTRDMQSAFRQFTGLVWLLRPELLNATQTALAENLGVTKAAMSRIAVKWSERLGGMRSGLMKSSKARESYREVQLGHTGTKGARPMPNDIGEFKENRKARIIRANRARKAILAFARGEAWDRHDIAALIGEGWLQDGELTDEGRETLAGLELKNSKQKGYIPYDPT